MKTIDNVKQWKSITIPVDIETGEIIKKQDINNYLKLKTKKHVTIRNSIGLITYTIECKRSQQGKLNFDTA